MILTVFFEHYFFQNENVIYLKYLFLQMQHFFLSLCAFLKFKQASHADSQQKSHA